MDTNYTITDSKDNYLLSVDIDIKESSWNLVDNLNDILLKFSKGVFTKLGLDKQFDYIEFSIIFTNNEEIQEINLKYRGKNSSTNTLSFPTNDENKTHGKVAILGDIIFAYQKVFDEAKEQKKEFKDHFAHLLIHSILHLLGYDHITEEEAVVMESLEVNILESFNIESPYNMRDY